MIFRHNIIFAVYAINLNIIVTGSKYSTDKANSSCPLWHFVNKANGCCECCNTESYMGIFECNLNQVEVFQGWCMTWNNATQDAEVGRCLFLHQDHKDTRCHSNHLNNCPYSIPANMSGSQQNNFICNNYHRKGAQCRECIDGYGPAVFSDAITCADCSKHKYHWILYFFIQLTMVTIMYVVVVLFKINGTASPLNIIITYSQISTTALMFDSGFHATLASNVSEKFVTFYLTTFGVWNLDFFRLILPPVCVSTATKTINILLFDYIMAFYPLLLTIIILVAIELYDRKYRVAIYLSIPVKIICLKGNWNPKETILKTCATFLLLSYSKFLFVSITLLLAVPIYNCSGDSIPISKVLLYDSTIRFLHPEHIPYVVLASSIIVVLVLLPPLLLLLYPTRFFRGCLKFMGFKRWDILHLVMDIFQGWFKDGTNNSVDCRPFSALYMLLRALFTLVGIARLLNIFTHHYWLTMRLFLIGLGVLLLTVKPYKKNWMNHTDGLILLLLGTVMLMSCLALKCTFILAIVIVTLVLVCVSLYFIFKCVKKCYHGFQ